MKRKPPLSPFEAQRKAAQRAAVNALKRARRSAEKAGVSLSEWEGEFLESADVFGNYYGTCASDTEAVLTAGVEGLFVEPPALGPLDAVGDERARPRPRGVVGRSAFGVGGGARGSGRRRPPDCGVLRHRVPMTVPLPFGA